ncbi:MAG: LexA repressor [Chloroflexi bacterium ADurb.Bin325]|nr:MAG: LexA repressor [Chloroflexi bacterium ADurb.Bin325]
MSLSDRQARILEFIDAYVQEHNYPPTIREIGKAVGISSTSVVKYNLERLQEKKKLERSKEVSRGLRLVKPAPGNGDAGGAGMRLVRVPKLGLISAGQPIAAAGQQDNPYADDTLTLTADLVPDRANLYALRVQGDSMIDALVHDGDWVIIEHRETAERGDMIVAWIEDKEETTLKYYHPEGATVRLQPANPAYQPIYVPAAQLQVQGKVLAIVRQLA